MKTDDLISMLAQGDDVAVRPAQRRQTARNTALLSGALAVSTLLMLGLLGVRPDLGTAAATPQYWIKVLFVALLSAAAWFGGRRLSRPGASIRLLPALIATPVCLAWIVAAAVLGDAPAGERAQLFWGHTWRVCPFLIALLALPVLAASLSVMRNLAPTRLRLAGAVAGFASGAAAALVYCLHCPEMAAPFVAFWYLLGMLIPAALGALLGPRVLAW